MSRDPYRTSTGSVASDRWDRDRLERERGPDRVEVRDDHFAHGAIPVRPRSPISRAPLPPRGGGARPYPDGDSDTTDSRSSYRDRDDFEDHYVYDRERERRVPPARHLSPSPPPASRVPRPNVLRRQSSLDTFDRPGPGPRFLDKEERYGAPARRDDYRPEPYSPIPLPRSRQLPPAAGEPIPLPRRTRDQYGDLPPRREYYESPHPPRRDLYNDPPPPRRELFDESPTPPRREAYDTPPPPARRPGFDEPWYRGQEPYPEAPLSAPPTRRRFPDDIYIADPGFQENEDSHPVHERELVHERRSRRTHRRGRGRTRSRSHSRDSKTTSTSKSHTVTSRSSSTSSSSSSSSGGTAVRSEYPKKGKTRIPARLVCKKALIDLNYPFEEEGGTFVILLALGQKNIDDVLRLSEDYKKAELEAEHHHHHHIVEETKVVQALPAPPHHHTPAPPPAVYTATPHQTQTQTVVYEQPQAPAPVHVQYAPPLQSPNTVEFIPPMGPPVEMMETRQVTREVTRDVSPARSYTTGTTDYTYTTSTSNPVDRLLESDHVHIGPLVLAKDHGHSRSRSRRKSKSKSRSRSRSRRGRGSALEAQIRELEAERDNLRHHRRHRRHRSSSAGSGDVVRYHQRLDNGELVVYEEKVEEFSDSDHSHHHHHRSKSRGARIERDKKGPPPKLLRAMLATLT